jgi:hypothetical protein
MHNYVSQDCEEKVGTRGDGAGKGGRRERSRANKKFWEN